jgi:hypothetical protein
MPRSERGLLDSQRCKFESHVQLTMKKDETGNVSPHPPPPRLCRHAEKQREERHSGEAHADNRRVSCASPLHAHRAVLLVAPVIDTLRERTAIEVSVLELAAVRGAREADDLALAEGAQAVVCDELDVEDFVAF